MMPNPMRIQGEIQVPPHVAPNFPQYPHDPLAGIAPSRQRGDIPVVKQTVELTTNEFPLMRALNLIHIALFECGAHFSEERKAAGRPHRTK